MPFDYLWQFLPYPVTNQEFYEGKIRQDKSKSRFNYLDSLRLFEKQNYIDQLIGSSYRIEKNGIKNALIFDRIQHLKIEIENYYQKVRVDLFNSAVFDSNEGVGFMNEFFHYKNIQFTPPKSDLEIQAMIESVGYKFNQAKEKLNQITNPDANLSTLMKQLLISIENSSNQVTEQDAWLKTYFSKGKVGRKSMFYEKRTF